MGGGLDSQDIKSYKSTQDPGYSLRREEHPTTKTISISTLHLSYDGVDTETNL